MQGSEYSTKLGTVADLACLLGLSSRRIYQLTQDGMFAIDGGKVVLSEAVQSYINALRKQYESFDEDAARADKERRIAEAKLKKSNAEVARIELRELEGKMHRAEDVETVIQDMLFSVRSALMALPGRLAVDVAEAKSAAEASAIIEHEVHAMMTELADYHYDPERFEAMVRERRKWEQEKAVTDEDEE